MAVVEMTICDLCGEVIEEGCGDIYVFDGPYFPGIIAQCEEFDLHDKCAVKIAGLGNRMIDEFYERWADLV